MPTREVAAEFDQISDVYDATREPLDAATIEGLALALHSAGARRILEVGIGTGRVAKPLLDRGFDITGVEPSRGMFAKARAKGIDRIVRGSGYRLPFADGAFDATLFVHVLHVLDDPMRAIHEAARVGRLGAFALVHPRSDDPSKPRTEFPRHLVRDILAEQGYPMPPRSPPWVKERDLLTRFPPDRLQVVSETDVTESLRDRIDRLEKRGQRQLLKVPPEVVHRAIATARERVGDRTVTYHRVEALATWGPGSRADGAVA
ncbi:MAG TPA: methyltransferase domain-containing protein [Thermoplasmata archaeon]|nr:methyltransferase domain-containing protein [Thermoplasmata archaeon]